VLDTIELDHPQLHYREPMFLARNDRGKFHDISAQSGEVFKKSWVSRGMAIGDLNNDGRVDVVVTTNGGAAYILRNETDTHNHWLALNLVGHTSNRDAIGAAVKIVTKQGTQMATVTTSGSYLSSSDKRVNFGLGGETTVPEVEIRWPSGIIQKLQNVKADQLLRVDEPPQAPAQAGNPK
jgi:hypothetical protein